jgi:hypothetical protein
MAGTMSPLNCCRGRTGRRSRWSRRRVVAVADCDTGAPSGAASNARSAAMQVSMPRRACPARPEPGGCPAGGVGRRAAIMADCAARGRRRRPR